MFANRPESISRDEHSIVQLNVWFFIMSAYTNDANVAYEDSHAVLEVGPPLELMGSPHRPSEDVHAAVPALPLARIFTLFLGFGLRSWGGPMAQIAMLRTYFIDEQKWISNARFNRVLAVYQALPGPEATELCCYFGMISRGRPGAAVAGLGFLLPGFFMVLLLSFLYDRYDIVRNEVFAASFAAVQAAVAAMVVRAVHRIAEGALKEERTGEFSFRLLIIAGMAAVQVAMGLNFFISLAFCGILNEALLWESLPFLAGRGAGNRVEFTNEPVDDITTTSRSSPVASPSSAVSPPSSATWIGIAVGVVFTVLCLVGYIIYVATVGWPKGDFVFGSSSSRSLGSLFGTGLLAGLLTFGGAYTAIPFVQQGVAAWMPSTVFLDGLALSAVVPAPLVIFTTFVGYIGGGFGGIAVRCAVGSWWSFRLRCGLVCCVLVVLWHVSRRLSYDAGHVSARVLVYADRPFHIREGA